MACTNASWKRRAITGTGTPAARSSSSALNVGAASNSTTDVSCAVLSAVAVFFTTATAYRSAAPASFVISSEGTAGAEVEKSRAA